MSETTFKHQVTFYFICGAMSTTCDFVLYYSMYHLGMPIPLAKGTSFLIASVISYFLNKHITFRSRRRSIKEFINFVVVHIGAMIIDVATNSFFILILGFFMTEHSKMEHSKILIGFILATGCSVIANFIGQKYWVFRRYVK